jgi:endonuclease YncB( thermonuclease family)
MFVLGAMAAIFDAGVSLASVSEPLVFDHRAISVIDGGSFKVGDTIYHLAGVAVPEQRQTCDHDGTAKPCERAAAAELRKLIELQASPIHCFDHSGADHLSTACFLNDRELSILLLESGYVAARPGAPLHYVAAERTAKRASLGIWRNAAGPPSGHAGTAGSGERDLPTTRMLDHRDIDVIDGDSFQVGSMVYRLAGIDAPELGQACLHGSHPSLCGLSAAYTLRKMFELASGPIECALESADDPSTAVCLVGDSEVSVLMLMSGDAVALPESEPYYRAAEHTAKRANLGIWDGSFVPPWDWRAGRRLPIEHNFERSAHLTGQLPWTWNHKNLQHRPASEHAACLVKGVVTETGERWYYGPLDEEFETIEIDPERGERLFCGDDEARAAGWRREGER